MRPGLPAKSRGCPTPGSCVLYQSSSSSCSAALQMNEYVCFRYSKSCLLQQNAKFGQKCIIMRDNVPLISNFVRVPRLSQNLHYLQKWHNPSHQIHELLFLPLGSNTWVLLSEVFQCYLDSPSWLHPPMQWGHHPAAAAAAWVWHWPHCQLYALTQNPLSLSFSHSPFFLPPPEASTGPGA